jgi:hypothetical protein
MVREVAYANLKGDYVITLVSLNFVEEAGIEAIVR